MRFVQVWIYTIFLSLCLTMGIGAMTRLTESGLSIVEWKPISGILPPLNDSEWQQEFMKYQQYPDYNSRSSMSLPEFKNIFWWEFIHRLVARSIILVIFLPYLYLYWRKRYEPHHLKKVMVLTGMVVVQGAIGWFMVKSGLVKIPRVSHLRLTIHLVWACLIILYLARWLKEENIRSSTMQTSSRFLKFLLGLCLAQMALGAWVAGSRAGYIYNTFPKFGDGWWPVPFFDNLGTVQFLHRLGGWLLLGAAVYALKRKQGLIAMLILLQFILGVSTLVLRIPPYLATLHQLVGVLLLFTVGYRAFSAKESL